jgi:hypothetical protein
MFDKMLTHFTSINLLNNLAKTIIFSGFIFKGIIHIPSLPGCDYRKGGFIILKTRINSSSAVLI